VIRLPIDKHVLIAEVFISYRREGESHNERVRTLALRLRDAGLDVTFDEFSKDELFHGNQPANGWPIWSVQQAGRATSVLVIASAGWFRVLNDDAEMDACHSAALVRFSTSPRTPDALLDHFADELGLPEPEGSTIDRRTRNFLDGRQQQPTILFFDGYEHAEHQHAQWVDLFLSRARRAPGLRCVIAGRDVPLAKTSIWSPMAL
jgi:hypothetical protein